MAAHYPNAAFGEAINHDQYSIFLKQLRRSAQESERTTAQHPNGACAKLPPVIAFAAQQEAFNQKAKPEREGRRMHDIKALENGITHHGRSYSWDGRAISLCERRFSEKEYYRPFFDFGVNCADCKEAMRKGERL